MAIVKTSGGQTVVTSGGRVLSVNCGTGAGGFKLNNTCATGGGRKIKNVEDATAALKELGVVTVDLPANKALAELAVEAVENAKARGWKIPTLINKTNSKIGVAYASVETIGLTKRRISREDFARQVSEGFWSQPNPVLHELAHIHHQDKVGLRFLSMSNWLNPDAQKDIAQRVSGYARMNPKEFVAETLAGMASGKTYDADVMRMYDTYGGPKP